MRQLIFLLAVTAALSCELKRINYLTNPSSGSSTIDVSWPALSDTDLNCVRGYRICLREGFSFERCKLVLDASISNYTITDLKSCGQYSISVAVLGENDTISERVTLSAITAPAPQSADVNFYRRNKDTIVAYWRYNGRDAERTCALRFELSLCDIRETNCTNAIVGAGGTNHNRNLPWKQDCNAFFLKMVVLDSRWQRTDTTYFYGAPGFIDVPENLRVTNYTSSSFDLEWALPASQIGCEFFARVYSRSITDSKPVSILDGSATTHTESGLSPCTKYEATVTYGTTETGKSAKTTVYTLPEGNTVFKSARVQSDTDTSRFIEWTTSLENKHCIAAYTVCWMVNGAMDVDCRNVTNDNNNLNITNLAAFTSYQYTITALLHNGAEFDKVYL